MERDVEPYSAAVDLEEMSPVLGAVFRAAGQALAGAIIIRPTQYRYQTLIERAKELVNIAQQMEAAFLSALERRDLEAYNELKARQDVQLTRAGVRLQDIRIQSAQNGVTLAELQQTRAQLQVESYQEWIDAGLNEWEQSMIQSYETAGAARVMSAFFDAATQIAQAATTAATASFGAAAAVASAAVVSIMAAGRYMATGEAIMTETQAQVASVWASFERRKQEWELQKALAQQDVVIGSQQIMLANDQVQIARQERTIANMQSEHAETIANFLANKFTNVELYDWMSGILEGVYSFFLQQATAMAKLAENQLAFERHEIPAGIIQPDYWEPPSEEQLGPEEETKERRGLTGSARLFRDIYQLDQYRFDTEKRKLQLTKTMSLSQLAPAELQRFRETGLITFATPMELFDREFPGHYLRLIKRVRVSVVALIPPAAGIRATLTSPGVSRVVVGGDVFQTIPIRRDPELIALTSPQNATGLFELNPQSEMLLPFEGNGVDTLWEFRMPKASNPFDFSTIANVLLTIEYTALDSDVYRQQVLEEMDPKVRHDRAFSLRQHFPDLWYHLHNPEDDSNQVTTSFKTPRQLFPPNISNIKIENVLLYFSRKDSVKVEVDYLYFLSEDGNPPLGGAAESDDGLISTRKGNASSWTSILGRPPFGEWKLAFPPEMIKRFKDNQIEDVLFVISYSGELLAWPQ